MKCLVKIAAARAGYTVTENKDKGTASMTWRKPGATPGTTRKITATWPTMEPATSRALRERRIKRLDAKQGIVL